MFQEPKVTEIYCIADDSCKEFYPVPFCWFPLLKNVVRKYSHSKASFWFNTYIRLHYHCSTKIEVISE